MPAKYSSTEACDEYRGAWVFSFSARVSVYTIFLPMAIAGSIYVHIVHGWYKQAHLTHLSFLVSCALMCPQNSFSQILHLLSSGCRQGSIVEGGCQSLAWVLMMAWWGEKALFLLFVLYPCFGLDCFYTGCDNPCIFFSLHYHFLVKLLCTITY
jgi:hypothetical protein